MKGKFLHDNVITESGAHRSACLQRAPASCLPAREELCDCCSLPEDLHGRHWPRCEGLEFCSCCDSLQTAAILSVDAFGLKKKTEERQVFSWKTGGSWPEERESTGENNKSFLQWPRFVYCRQEQRRHQCCRE